MAHMADVLMYFFIAYSQTPTCAVSDTEFVYQVVYLFISWLFLVSK